MMSPARGRDVMKVLHVLPFPGVGGTEIATRRIADAVKPFGIQSVALLLRPTKELQSYLQESGIPCIDRLRRPEPSFVREAVNFLRDSWSVARIFQKFDLVHCADVSAAYHVAVAGRLACRPVLCHVRNRDALLPWRQRAFIAAAGHFVFVSHDTRSCFSLRLSGHRTSVLYDGVDIPPHVGIVERATTMASVRAEFGLPKESIIAAMIARVNPQKDYETLIRAAAILRGSHPDLRFLIVGDNAHVESNQRHFAHVELLACAAGVRDRFIFSGFRSDIHRLLIAANLCVLCTHFEGLPLALLEAMAAGRACVATAVDGIPEALTDGVTGLMHAHGDAERLAAAIARLAGAPDIADTMGAKARADVERRFGHDRFARNVQALYTELVRRPWSHSGPRMDPNVALG